MKLALSGKAQSDNALKTFTTAQSQLEESIETLDAESGKADVAIQKLEEKKKAIEQKKVVFGENKERAKRVLGRINEILE